MQRLREEFHKMKQDKEELEAEFEQLTSRSTSQSEVGTAIEYNNTYSMH